MRKPTPAQQATNRRDWHDFYRSAGMASLNGFDRQRMLDTIRERRHHHSGEDWVQALGALSEAYAGQMADEVPGFDRDLAVSVLLELSSLLVSLATSNVDGHQIVNVIGFMADDLDRENADGEGGGR